jgi:hypothetical protein
VGRLGLAEPVRMVSPELAVGKKQQLSFFELNSGTLGSDVVKPSCTLSNLALKWAQGWCGDNRIVLLCV